MSSKLEEWRYLRPEIDILKQFLENKDIECIVWILDELQIAYILTKPKAKKIGVVEMVVFSC